MTQPQEPLDEFLAWHTATTKGAQFDPMISQYALAKMAFYAGFAARPRPPVEPSREALEKTRYVPQREPARLRAYDPPQSVVWPDMPEGDRTVRYQGPPASDYDWTTSTQGKSDIRDHLESQRVHGPTGPNPGLSYADRVLGSYLPAPEGPAQPVEHTETVWTGTVVKADDFDYGFPGRVQSIPELTDPEG